MWQENQVTTRIQQLSHTINDRSRLNDCDQVCETVLLAHIAQLVTASLRFLAW